MHFFFEVPIKEPPPGSPTGPLRAGLPVYKAFFYIHLKFLIKISVTKEIFPFSQKRYPYGNIRPFPEPYLAYSLGSLVEEPSLQVPLI